MMDKYVLDKIRGLLDRCQLPFRWTERVLEGSKAYDIQCVNQVVVWIMDVPELYVVWEPTYLKCSCGFGHVHPSLSTSVFP